MSKIGHDHLLPRHLNFIIQFQFQFHITYAVESDNKIYV
jgi:hypothetical protein